VDQEGNRRGGAKGTFGPPGVRTIIAGWLSERRARLDVDERPWCPVFFAATFPSQSMVSCHRSDAAHRAGPDL
jgi:hypothetical protein